MTAPKPTSDDVAKAEALIDMAKRRPAATINAIAQAIAAARAQGRADGIREAADCMLAPGYDDRCDYWAERILALIATPQEDDQ